MALAEGISFLLLRQKSSATCHMDLSTGLCEHPDNIAAGIQDKQEKGKSYNVFYDLATEITH